MMPPPFMVVVMVGGGGVRRTPWGGRRGGGRRWGGGRNGGVQMVAPPPAAFQCVPMELLGLILVPFLPPHVGIPHKGEVQPHIIGVPRLLGGVRGPAAPFGQVEVGGVGGPIRYRGEGRFLLPQATPLQPLE